VLAVSPFTGTKARHLYVYSKISPTPARYPRRAGLAAKRPLA
jgi:16S rRNA (guanine527-N7)-methyltransferase